jgi:CheY-like chemotaxis protein
MSAAQPAHRVLLVDDEGAVRSMMNEALKRKGFETVRTCRGRRTVSTCIGYLGRYKRFGASDQS